MVKHVYGISPQAEGSSELEDAVHCESWELDQLAARRRGWRGGLWGERESVREKDRKREERERERETGCCYGNEPHRGN